MPHGWGFIAKKKKKIDINIFYVLYTPCNMAWASLQKKKINKKKIRKKKYSKSPSVVHSIRASYANAAMFSCKKSNLAGRVPTSRKKKKLSI